MSPITRRDVARYPTFYLAEESPGYPMARAARCGHEVRLTDACADCRVVNAQPLCGPPAYAAMSSCDEIAVAPRHIAAWRASGPGSWLVALPGQVVIRADDRRAPGAVEIGPYERLGEVTERLSAAHGVPNDHELARAFTGIATDLLIDTPSLDAWDDVAEALRQAAHIHGLCRADVSSIHPLAADLSLSEWRQSFGRRDGAPVGVTLIQAAEKLLVTVTAWHRTVTAALPTPKHGAGHLAPVVAACAARHLDGRHPGPSWAIGRADREPKRGDPLWRITHGVLTQIARTIDGPYARPGHGLAELITAAVAGSLTAAGCPPSGEAWVRRQVIYRVLLAAHLPTQGPRDRRNTALLACLARRHGPQLARQLRISTHATSYHAGIDR